MNFESPIEEMFYTEIAKYLDERNTIVSQHTIETNNGNFRMDFVVTTPSKKIGIECDGKEFHDEYRDELRDGIILGEGKLDQIIRIKGKDVFLMMNEVLVLINAIDPTILNERFKLNSKVMTSRVPDVWGERARFKEDLERDAEIDIHIDNRRADRKLFWNTFYQFAKKHPGKSIDELIPLFEKSL